MANNDRKALKSGVWYTLSNLLVKCMALITTPIFTRLLTKGEFGEYNNFLSWCNIVVIIVSLRVESSLISARYEYKDRFGQYSLSILALSGVSTACWMLICNLFPETVSGYLGVDIIYINLMLIYAFFFTVVGVFQACERYAFRYKQSVFVALLIAVGSTLASVVLVLIMKDNLCGRILGYTVPPILIGAVLLVRIFREGRPIDTSFWKFALKISLPYIPHLLSLQVLHSTNKLMITNMCGAEQTAMYSVAYTAGHIVSFLVTSLNMAFSPWLAEKVAENDKASIRKVSKTYIYAFAFMAFGMMLLSPEILLIMGGKGYLQAKYVMAPIAVSCVCQFLYTLYVNIEQIRKKTVGMAIASAIAACLNIVINLLLIPRFGYESSAYATLISYIALLAIHWYLVRRMNYTDVYDTRIVVGIVALMVLLIPLINLLYNSTILRYTIILVYAVVFLIVAWKNKELIFSIFRKDKKES